LKYKYLDSAAQASTGLENIMEFAAPAFAGASLPRPCFRRGKLVPVKTGSRGTAFLKPIYTKLTTHISSKILAAGWLNDSMENLTFALSNYI